MSIAALVTAWRNDYDPNYPGADDASIPYPDPRWSVDLCRGFGLASADRPCRCIALNATSLIFGVVGNVFLLFNFTRRIRYIIALPMTIVLWYFATGIVGRPGWRSRGLQQANPLISS